MKLAAVSQALLVGAGGFVGSILRYALSGFVHRLIPHTTFPYGTLTVNIVGCLIIGLLTGLAESRQLIGPDLRLLLLIGLLGGFTTYSTFGYETFAMIRNAEVFRAIVSVTLHIVIGLSAVWIGQIITRTW